MRIRQYWLATFEGHALAAFTSWEQFKQYTDRQPNTKFGCTTCPMIDCQKCGVFPRNGGDECPVCGATQDSNYKLELIVDTSNFNGIDGDDAWEFPATFETSGLEISPGYGHFIKPHGSSKPYSEIETDVRELIEEWRNLVMNNDLVAQKIKITLNVECVFE